MPAVIVCIPTPLQPFTQGSKQVRVEAATVGEALECIGQQYPPLRRQILTRDGQLRRYVNLFVRQQDIRALDGLATPIEHGDELIVMPSVAGG